MGLEGGFSVHFTLESEGSDKFGLWPSLDVCAPFLVGEEVTFRPCGCGVVCTGG